MPSIFSRIIAGEIPCDRIWEDESFFAFLDINPVQPGHVLLVTKQEVDAPYDLDDAAYAAFFLAAKRLIEPIRRAMGSVKVALAIEGLEVSHAHIHLIPISKPGDFRAPGHAMTSEERAIIAEKIRAEIAKG